MTVISDLHIHGNPEMSFQHINFPCATYLGYIMLQ